MPYLTIESMNAVSRRVFNQMALVHSVDPVEAYSICVAHARFLTATLATASDSDAEFAESLQSLFMILSDFGSSIRRGSR